MRLFGRLTVIVAAAGVAAACQGESQQRQSLIDSGVQACVSGIEKAGGGSAGSGINAQRVCTCALTKMTEGKSVDEIREISRRSNPSQEDLQAMGSCMVEEAQRSFGK